MPSCMLNLLKLEGLGVDGTREEELIKISCVYGYNCALSYLETVKKFKRARNKANSALEKLQSSRSSEEPSAMGIRGKRVPKRRKSKQEEDSNPTEPTKRYKPTYIGLWIRIKNKRYKRKIKKVSKSLTYLQHFLDCLGKP